MKKTYSFAARILAMLMVAVMCAGFIQAGVFAAGEEAGDMTGAQSEAVETQQAEEPAAEAEPDPAEEAVPDDGEAQPMAGEPAEKPEAPKPATLVHDLFTIQCTEVPEHKYVSNGASTWTKVNADMAWDEGLGAWTNTLTISMTYFNLTTTRKNYFGGHDHHYENSDTTVKVYWDPDYTGPNSSNTTTTGLWRPVGGPEGQVIEWYCYTQPAVPQADEQLAKAICSHYGGKQLVSGSAYLWLRDVDNTKTYWKPDVNFTQTVTDKLSVGEIREGEDGVFYLDVAITDLQPWVDEFNAQKGAEAKYAIDWARNESTASDYKFVLRYAGNMIDYKQDGTGWCKDPSTAWVKPGNALNGHNLYLVTSFTVAYHDDAGSELASEMVKVGDSAVGYTPDAREGYTFEGWATEQGGEVVYTPDSAITPTDSSLDLYAVFKKVLEFDTASSNHYYNPSGDSIARGKSIDYQTYVVTKDQLAAGVWHVTAHVDTFTDKTPTVTVNRLDQKKVTASNIRYDKESKTLTFDLTATARTYARFTIAHSRPTTSEDIGAPVVSTATVTVTTDTATGTFVDSCSINVLPSADAPQYLGVAQSWDELPEDAKAEVLERGLNVCYPDANGRILVGTDAETVTVVYKFLLTGDPGYTMTGPSGQSGDRLGETATIPDSGELYLYFADTHEITEKWAAELASYAGRECLSTSQIWINGYQYSSTKLKVNIKYGYDVVYTDGVEGAAFASQSFFVGHGEKTPAFDGTPARDGYIFAGWDPALTESAVGDVTYAARWNMTVTVDGQELTVAEGTTAGDLEGPETREGYAFVGWVDENGEPVADGTVLTPGAALSSAWSLTVTVDGEEQVVAEGTTVGELTAPTKEGYTFAGWVDANGKPVADDTVLTPGMELTASWTEIPVATAPATAAPAATPAATKSPDKTAPETGDDASLALWAALGVSCALALGAVLIFRRREN